MSHESNQLVVVKRAPLHEIAEEDYMKFQLSGALADVAASLWPGSD